MNLQIGDKCYAARTVVFKVTNDKRIMFEVDRGIHGIYLGKTYKHEGEWKWGDYRVRTDLDGAPYDVDDPERYFESSLRVVCGVIAPLNRANLYRKPVLALLGDIEKEE